MRRLENKEGKNGITRNLDSKRPGQERIGRFKSSREISSTTIARLLMWNNNVVA